MIPQATESFWQKLEALDFLAPDQVGRWKAYANEETSNWAELCKRIEAESVLRPAHLNQLSSHNGQRVVWGNYLLLRPAYHPLGWQTYRALHAKLHKEFRLIFLPSSQIDVQTGKATQTVYLLERAKKVASISSNDIVKVIDIELFDDVMVAVTQLPAGRRMTEQLSQNRFSDSDWAQCIESLCSDLFLIHDAGVLYGGVDPLTIQLDSESNRCRLDFLISNPILTAAESVPMDLASEEQTNIVEYRSLRAQRIPNQINRLSTEFDWKTLGTLFYFLANKLSSTDNAFWTDVETFGVELESSVQPTRSMIAHWCERLKSAALPASTLPASTLPASTAHTSESAPETSVNQKRPNEQVVSSSKIEAGSTNPQNLRGEQKTSPSLSDRRQQNKRKDDRQKLVTLLAVLTPLPLVMIGGLIYYFGWIADAPLPTQLTDSSPVGELPEMQSSVVDDSDQKDNVASRSKQKEKTSDSQVKNQPDDLTEDVMAKEAVDNAKTEATGKSTSEPKEAKETAEPADQTGTSSDLPTPMLEDSKSTPVVSATENDDSLDVKPEPSLTSTNKSVDSEKSNSETPNSETPNSETPNSETPRSNSNTATFTFEGILTSVDIASSLSEKLEQLATDGKADQPVIFSLGKINSVTAKNAIVSWTAAEGTQVEIKETDSQSFVKRWQIFGPTETDPLAYLQATAAGEFELAVLPQAESSISLLMRSRLELGFADDATLKTSVRFAEPRKVARLEIGNKGSIRGVVWETPELAGQDAFLKLSMSGTSLNKLPVESEMSSNLGLKRGDELYYTGETLNSGSLVLVAKFSPGKKSRFQAQLNLMTPQGLVKFDEPDKAAAVAEYYTNLKQQWANQYAQIDSVRAKPGEGAIKKQKLDELEAMQKGADAFLKTMEDLLNKGETYYSGGVDFELRMGSESSSIVLLESVSPPPEEVPAVGLPEIEMK